MFLKIFVSFFALSFCVLEAEARGNYNVFKKVQTFLSEAKEYQENGEVRTGLVQELMESGIPFNNLIFEAPLKHQQVWFIENYGVETNFGNIALNDIIGLETFRRGLRGDTIFLQSS